MYIIYTFTQLEKDIFKEALSKEGYKRPLGRDDILDAIRELQDNGIISSYVNRIGEVVYRVTEKGKHILMQSAL